MNWNDEPSAPLRGIKVVDLSVLLTGPFLTRLLAQQGAEVIKIERPPHGDPFRAPLSQDFFEGLNQGKRSFAVDFTKTKGRDLVYRLLADADVVVENFREGVLTPWGLDYASVAAVNPKLIYLSLRGFAGSEGELPGHDMNFLATSGVGDWYLENGAPNYSSFFGPIAGGVLVPLTRLLAHLANPERRGMHLVSYLEEALRVLYYPRAFEAVRSFEKSGTSRSWSRETFGGKLPSSGYFRCRDGGWISFQPFQPKHWEDFCQDVARPEWSSRREDPALLSELENFFLGHESTDWEKKFQGKRYCVFRVIPWAEHLTYSDTRTRFQTDPLTWAGFAPCPGLAPCPKLGQDTVGLLTSLGASAKEISETIAAGIVTAAG